MLDVLILFLVIILLPSVLWILFITAALIIGTVVAIFDMGKKE